MDLYYNSVQNTSRTERLWFGHRRRHGLRHSFLVVFLGVLDSSPPAKQCMRMTAGQDQSSLSITGPRDNQRASASRGILGQ